MLEKLIEDINYQVWYGNKKENSELFINPKYAINLIKTNAELLLSDSKMINKCIKEIEILVCGEILPEEKSTRLRNMPEFVSKLLIEYCIKVLDFYNSIEDPKIINLNKKYKNKFLYFEGHENGSVIIFIDKILYKGKKIIWNGGWISLPTENFQYGLGINFNLVEEATFEELPYFSWDKDWVIISPLEIKEIFKKQLCWGFELFSDIGGLNINNPYE